MPKIGHASAILAGMPRCAGHGAPFQAALQAMPLCATVVEEASIFRFSQGGMGCIMDGRMDVAVLGGGCFWCLEAVYQEARGVAHVEAGYTGGAVPHPTYEQICTGDTGHAEVVRLEFDPAVISYHDILEIFFTIHDPTTLNRQGNDVGTQYRSVIYYQSAEQEKVARKVLAEMAGVWDAPIVTELAPAQPYYKAEEYHQHYVEQHPLQGYCACVVAPKVEKFRAMYAHRLK
eukprot:gene19034-22782_t